jgi:hypothetical protein
VIESIQHAGGRVTSLWVADFAADQFDLRYVAAGTERLMRVGVRPILPRHSGA